MGVMFVNAGQAAQAYNFPPCEISRCTLYYARKRNGLHVACSLKMLMREGFLRYMRGRA